MPLRLPEAFVLVAALAGVDCGASRSASPLEPTPSAQSPGVISTAAKTHLDQLVDTMQKYSINTGRIDWNAFRAEVLAAAGAAQTIPETYHAVARALGLLNDTQSYYQGADRSVIGPSPVGGCAGMEAARPELPATIGYVKVEACDCSERDAARYAQSMHDSLMAIDRPGLSGWIVDFRGNVGGNMWPMIAGVGPILGEGIIGFIIYNDRDYEREYIDGAALSLKEVFASAERPYKLIKDRPKVAVLTDGAVASAGEAVVVYFKARPDTRSFGMPTCGHHHLQIAYGLGNGAVLHLAASEHADRTKKRHAGPLVPDELIGDPASLIRRAVTWLQTGI